jgi:hypothetical protein
MADNVTLPGTGAVVETKDQGGGVERQVIEVGSIRAVVGPVPVDTVIQPSANFTRPANTTAYAAGQLVANSVTAGSVVPLSWTAARIAAGNFFIRRARLKKSTTTLTAASFRLHLYAADPSTAAGISNGDGGAWLTKHASYLGSIYIAVSKAFSDAAAGQGSPEIGAEINVALASGQTIYGLLEARDAYAPGNAEVFTVELELHQN